MYRAQIEFQAYEDDYNKGQSIQCDNMWHETLEAETQTELREKVLEATYSNFNDLDDTQMNEYENWTEYSTGYMADENNEGEATADQLDAFQRGECRLWAINCHILVSQVTESKAVL